MGPKECTHDLREKIKKMRDEELEHKDTAQENGASRSPSYHLLNRFIQAGCKAAIAVVSKA